MDKAHLKKLIQKGEGISVEFKRASLKLNKDVFESVCAFLNRHGGHLFLGVEDDATICGIKEDCIFDILDNFVILANNPQKLFPPFYMSPKIIELDGKKIIYIYVPQSSQVHNTAGNIFDRNMDGDFNVTKNSSHVSQLYMRKRTTYSENKVFPYAKISDLRPDLVERARIRAKNENGVSHPWFGMSDKELLQSAQLFKKDLVTGQEGLTLAAILLFGKDETILNALPHHKTDAILRRENLDRYDDRDDIRTNLIESHDRLMKFVAKHLPDPFYQEGVLRVSLRSKIFREGVTNLLIHREFLNAFPAKMIIEQDRVVFENGNRPNGHGLIDPEAFTPFPKNPIIARVFKEIGFADELGSGVKNLFKYTTLFSKGENPELMEDDIFRLSIPLTSKTPRKHRLYFEESPTKYPSSTHQAPTKYPPRGEQVVAYCKIARSLKEIMDYLKLKDRGHFRQKILNPLINEGFLFMTKPESPNNSQQKYYSKEEDSISFVKEKAAIYETKNTHPPTKYPSSTHQVPTKHPPSPKQLVHYCKTARSLKEIMHYFGFKDRGYFRKKILNPLLEEQLLFMTIPDKKNNPKQKYYSK